VMHLIDAKVSGHDQALPQRHDLFDAAGCEPQPGRPTSGPRHQRSDHLSLLHELGARATRRSLIGQLPTRRLAFGAARP